MAMHRVSGARWLRCALAATALAAVPASAQIAGATVRGSITLLLDRFHPHWRDVSAARGR